MTKKSNKSSKSYPMVSVCTPTFNRRPFIKSMFDCFRNQDYPKSRIEWIIVDDGTDKIKDLVESSNIPQIRYFDLPEKIALGKKRNFMHDKAKGSFIVYMDDDDYYPPERISHAVERLQSDPKALCAGSSEIYLYFKGMNKMIQAGPYGPKHATAGTFAFRRDLLDQTRYDDDACIAEEREFLKGYTIPFIQLDPLKTILVFSHEHNTYDKRKMFDKAHPDYFRESPKTVDMFIRKESESSVKKFFMEDIDDLLKDYDPGLPNMKPDVLKQMKIIEEQRAKAMEEQIRQQQHRQETAHQPIVMNRPNQPPVQLNSHQVIDIITQQQNTIKELTDKMAVSGQITKSLQTQLIDVSTKLNAANITIHTLEEQIRKLTKEHS